MIGLKNLITQGDNIMKIADKNEFEKQNVFGTGTPKTLMQNILSESHT